MLFELGTYILDIDVEKTRIFYKHAPVISNECNCQGCRNYSKWAEELCAEPKHILERMGVQLEKTPEVYVNCQNEDGTLYYGGFYHLCGTIVSGKNPWKVIEGNAKEMDADALISLGEGFRVAFSEDVSLLEKDFPTPAIQMEISAKIPFVLTEKCDYPVPNDSFDI